MIRFKNSALIIGVAVAGILAVGGMTGASASTAPLNVTLSACGTGSSATWSSAGNPVLTIGTAPAATCGAPKGSTYDPAFAQITVNGVAGTAVPAAPPSFTTDNFAAGSPRWVINFSNGTFTTGYPVQLGVFAGVTPTTTFTGNQWGVGNGSSYMTWAKVLTALKVTSSTTVTQAYIVEDLDQAAGTADTLTNVQYNGRMLPPTFFVQATALSRHLVLDARNGGGAGNGTAAQVWTQAGQAGGGNLRSQSWQKITVPGGYALNLAGTGLCLDVRNFGVANGTKLQLWQCGAAHYVDQTFYDSGTGQIGALNASQIRGVTMVIDDPDGAGSFTQLQIWQANGRAQQSWSVG